MTLIKKFAVILAVGFVVGIVSGFAIYNTVADDVQTKFEEQHNE